MAAFLPSNALNSNAPPLYEVIGYYRLSKLAKRSESESIANQRKLVREYIARHEDMVLVGEEYDDGYTGTNYDRPGFCAVLEAVKSGRANCVIVKDLSRLGREYIETGKYLEMTFPAMGVRFISINDDIDSTQASASDDLIIPIKNIMNEDYCRGLSKKLRTQFRVQRSKGEFLGAFACYGYFKSPEDKHRLLIDEYAAEIVKAIFSMKVKGYSPQAIAQYLNAEGVLPPSQYKRQQGLKYKSGFQKAGACEWTPMTVRKILENLIYIGTLVQGKRGTPNYKVKKMRTRKESEWVVAEQTHEAIVSEHLFQMVQRMMNRDTRTSPLEKTVQPLAGILYCGDCHRAMCRRSVKRGNNTFYYYVCSAYKRDHSCSSHSFSQEKLETAVLHAVRQQIEMVVELDELLAAVSSSDLMAAKTHRLDVMLAEKEKELEGYQEFRMKLLEALHDGMIDKEEYDQMRRKYSGLIETAKHAIEGIQEKRNLLILEATGSRAWAKEFARHRNVRELNREMAVSLIDKIYVYEDKRLQIDFNFRDEIAYHEDLLRQLEKEVG